MSGELYGFNVCCEACGEDHQKLHIWEGVGGTLRVTCMNHPKPFNVFFEALAVCREDREAEATQKPGNPEGDILFEGEFVIGCPGRSRDADDVIPEGCPF